MTLGRLLQHLGPKEQRGSKPRCHLLTHGNRWTVAARLTALLAPHGRVDVSHFWLPDGFADVTEGKLGETPGLLSDDHREIVTDWWLAVRENANTPNWDIGGTCDVGGRPGLFLVEAKAHLSEMKRAGKSVKNRENSRRNHERIGGAIIEARDALNGIAPSWALSRDGCYQLSNRFAWSWKVASLGVPVILVYLGFRDADEMRDQGPLITSKEIWVRAVKEHANKLVPDIAWENPLNVAGTPLISLIRSARLDLGLPPVFAGVE